MLDNTTPHSEKPTIPPKEDDLWYQTLTTRRLGYDTMLWQTPVLSLTAQAFLFAIALDGGSTRPGRFTSGLLSVLISVASIHLMRKHRYMEEADSYLLRLYELRYFECAPLHVPAHERPSLTPSLIAKSSSYMFWVKTLAVFGFAALVPTLAALFNRNWFGP